LLDTNKMRDQLRANPSWTKIEALEALLGMTATQRHHSMAEKSDGRADDERVKWSIPDQVDRWKLFYDRDAAPGYVLTAAQVFEFIQIDRFDDGQALGFSSDHVRNTLLPDSLRASDFIEVSQPRDYWVDLYQRTHGRDPDAEGLAFWQAWLEAEFMKGMEG